VDQDLDGKVTVRQQGLAEILVLGHVIRHLSYEPGPEKFVVSLVKRVCDYVALRSHVDTQDIQLHSVFVPNADIIWH